MDSVVGEDQTLPFDINGSCSISRLPEPLSSHEFSMDDVTASMFPGQKMSPAKALTMKDYENQITALKKENFNLKLRIYFLEERVQRNCDDSTEDIYKTNIELKVEVESMKRELSEKQDLLVSASKALESLASRDSGEGVRERAQREMDSLRDAFSARISELEESLRCAEEEVEKMASIAEQEKLRCLALEKDLQATAQSQPSSGPGSTPGRVHELQQALQEKDGVIERLQESIKNQDALIGELQKKCPEQPVTEQMAQLSVLIGQKDKELQALKDELDQERQKTEKENQACSLKQEELKRLQQTTKQLSEDLHSTKNSSQTLKHRLEEMDRENKALSAELEQRDGELGVERRNSLKRDKTIQGLSLLLKEKEKEVEELYGNLEEKEQTLAKTREAIHKAQLQKYQGAEEQQALLLSQQVELARLQAEAHASLLEAQRLQRCVGSREAELDLLRQEKQQLEAELDLMQQQKRKGDKTINDLQNQLKKLIEALAERENALEHQSQEQQEQNHTTQHQLHSTIQHLNTTLTHKEQQLQDYMNMVRDLEQDRAPGGSDITLTKLRERLREKEKALENALDEKFVAVEEKENEVHMLQLSVREKEREVERLNNLLSHNEETINSFDTLLKEKDVELQQLVNTVKTVQRSRQESEVSLQRALREKDSIIQQLQHSLQLKTTDMEELASTVCSQTETQGRDVAERMGQRLKVTEVTLAEAVKDRDRLVCENQTAVENLLATINSKDQLLKECVERHNQALSARTAELQDLRRQLSDARKPVSTATEDTPLETAQLRASLAEKDAVINKLLAQVQERDGPVARVKVSEALPPQVLELRQTIEVLQEKLEEREAELSRRNSEENLVKSPPVSKKATVLLKKELAQKTQALNSALRRENQLKMSLADLQSMVSELEGRLEGQTANIESLTSTLNTKEEIIVELQDRLTQRGERQLSAAQDGHSQPGDENSFRSLPQRERTIIGGDSQQVVPSLGDLRLEQTELNRVLRAEQQLYSNLVRAVKEQDSVQQLQALQLELAAVTLFRQQLEDGIRDNESLREQLHREIQRANQREGADPAELESMRDALEEAQRWNTSLQARLGQIQSRGGGVGQANDSVDTLSLIGEQTSYMSICVGAGLEEELQQMSEEQLRLKVSELQAINVELERRLALAENGIVGNAPRDSKGEPYLIDLSSPSKQPQGLARLLANDAPQTLAVHAVKEKVDDVQSEAAEGRGDSPGPPACNHQGGDRERTDRATESVSPLRAQATELRWEASEVRSLLKEGRSAEDSVESSGEGDGQTDLRQVVRTLRAEARSHRKVIRLLKEQVKRNGGATFDPDLRTDQDASQRHAHSQDKLKGEKTETHEEGGRGQSIKLTKSQKHHMARHAAYVRSRLPVPVRPARRASRRDKIDRDTEESSECRSGTDSERGLRRSHSSSSDSRRNRDSRRKSDFPESELLSQLELLNQECQEKEELITRFQAQLQEWAGLRAELLEKDRLNGQYVEALQAAESTIAYLTACSLDAESGLGQSGPGSESPTRRVRAELERAAQEKDQLSARLLEWLSAAESALTSPTTDDGQSGSPCLTPGAAETRDLSSRLDGLLIQIKALQERGKSSAGADGGPVAGLDLQHHSESSLQGEMLRAAEDAITRPGADARGLEHSGAVQDPERTCEPRSRKRDVLEEDRTRLLTRLAECVMAAERAVESIAVFGARSNKDAGNPDPSANRELQQNLDRLHQALVDTDQLGDLCSPDVSQSSITGPDQPKSVLHISHTATSAPQKTSTPIPRGQQDQKRPNIHDNLLLLLRILREHAGKVRELEEGLVHEQDRVLQLEHLQKAFKEQQEACRTLEGELAAAQAKMDRHTDPGGVRPGERDDKGVQVDAQDLGYETGGRSETEVDREEGSGTDVDGTACLDRVPSPLLTRTLAGSSIDNLDTGESSPCYPSSPDLSSPRPRDPNTDAADLTSDPAVLCQQLQQLRSQVEGQRKVIHNLQRLLRKTSLSAEILTMTSDPVDREEEEDRRAMKAQIAQLTTELERERTVNSQSASPSRVESLVQVQARELSELREQIRASRLLGVGQRRQLLELRTALEELMMLERRADPAHPDSPAHPALDASLRNQLDHSLDLLDKLQHGDGCVGDVEGAELELAQRLSTELREKDRLIQQLRDQLCGHAPGIHSDSDSEMSDRISKDNMASFIDSCSLLHTHISRTSRGMKAAGVLSASGGVSGGVGVSDGGEERVRTLQRENNRLQEQLRSSEELSSTLRSELHLTRSILAHTQAQSSPSGTHTQSSPSGTHAQSSPSGTHAQSSPSGTQAQSSPSGTQAPAQSPATAISQEQQCLAQQQADNKSISSELLVEHLQEVRALRQRLEETIRTNERLREQLERKLQVADRDPDKQKQIDHLRETLTRRTAKLDLSRKECEALRQEHTHLRDKLYRLQCDSKLQKQQLADTQQLLQTVQVELQVHEQIRDSTHTGTGEGRVCTSPLVGPGEGRVCADSGTVDLSELLSEVRRLRLQLERSVQTNTALRQKLEQQLLTRSDAPSTININYLLPTTDEGFKSEKPPQHSRPGSSSPAHDSGSSVGCSSPAPSRLVPGHRLWADGHGRHVLGLVEDYSALRKHIRQAKRLTADMNTQLHEGHSCQAVSGSMLVVLEEAERLLKLFWRVTLPSGDLTHIQQEEVLRSEVSRLQSRLSQQERMLTGAVKRLRSTNQLREGMERIIIDQLSMTHGVLKKARGNLESNYGSILGLEGLRVEGHHPECPVSGQSAGPSPRMDSTEDQHTDSSPCRPSSIPDTPIWDT
ncbi:CDK5 regulatory subunit-associated protein 2 isoform X2 [Brachyhypopomus gauderio]|uniref:CDK5 regulatory subunit-associated protein 2 isoform X2 n=1 Tax=Brachyhypopomus gauderio TaxID=698409 RepID=UPI00404332BD